MRAISLTQADIYKGELILVNAEHPYFENLAKPNLVPAASGNADILLEQNTATHLSQVMEKINGWQQIVPVSGWRSLKEQQDIFKQSLKDNGRTFTQQFVYPSRHWPGKWCLASGPRPTGRSAEPYIPWRVHPFYPSCRH